MNWHLAQALSLKTFLPSGFSLVCTFVLLHSLIPKQLCQSVVVYLFSISSSVPAPSSNLLLALSFSDTWLSMLLSSRSFAIGALFFSPQRSPSRLLFSITSPTSTLVLLTLSLILSFFPLNLSLPPPPTFYLSNTQTHTRTHRFTDTSCEPLVCRWVPEVFPCVCLCM